MYAGVGSTGRGRLDRMAEHRAKRVFERRLDRDLAGLWGPAGVAATAITERESDLTLSWKGAAYGTSSIWAIGAPSPRRGMSFMVRVNPPGRLW